MHSTALLSEGWSARQASIEAVGTPILIMNMRRGRVPSIERFRSLCEVLGLEYYVGRPRTIPGAEFDVDHLAITLKAVADGFPDVDRRLSVHDRVQLLVAVCSLVSVSDPVASAARVRGLTAIVRRFGVADEVRE